MQYILIMTSGTDFQEALDLRHDADKEALHFAHSMVETAATFFVLVVQMLNTRMGYVKVCQN